MAMRGFGRGAGRIGCVALAVCLLLAGCARPGPSAAPGGGATPMPSAGSAGSGSPAAGATGTAATAGTPGASAAAGAAGTAGDAPQAQSGTGSVKAGGIVWRGYDRDVLLAGSDGIGAGQDGAKEAHLQLSLTALGRAKLTGCEVQYSSEDFAYDFVQGGAVLLWLDGRAVPVSSGADITPGAHVVDIYLYTLVGEGGAALPLDRGRLDAAVRVTGAGGEQAFRGTINNPK